MRRMRRLFLTFSGLLVCLGLRPALGDETTSLSDIIDRHIQVRLDTDGLQRAAQADDGEFLRRVYLDLHGVVPSAEQAAKFLDRSDPDKRTQLIDELLASPRFGEHIADLWSGRLLSPTNVSKRAEKAYKHGKRPPGKGSV